MKFSKLPFLLLILVLVAAPALAKTTTYHLDEVYSISPDGTIFLYTNDADVLIVGSDRTDVHVVVDYVRNVTGLGVKSDDSDFEVSVSEENGNLRIREMEGSHTYVGVFVSIQEDYTVTIEAPSSAHLQIVGDDDDYLIHGFKNGIRLRLEDGRARLRDMSGSSFEFETEDGDIELQGGTGMLDVSVEDGSFTCEEGAFSSATANVEDGTIQIETSLSEDGDYRFRAEDGDIEFRVTSGGGDFSVYFEDGRVRADGGFKLEEEDDNFRSYRLPDGNAHVRFRVEDGSISLRSK